MSSRDRLRVPLAGRERAQVEYRVVTMHWDGHDKGADHLERTLNEFAADGWEVVSVLPTVAGASVRSLIATSASAGTTEIAVVLKRAVPTSE